MKRGKRRRKNGERWLVKDFGRKWHGAGGMAAEDNPDGEDRPTLLLYDQIGEDWFGDGISAKAIMEALEKFKDAPELDVRINSPGGLVFEGITIYNALARFPGKVFVHIDGSAFSIATLVAMAGDEIRMADNAMFMVHSPWGFTMGNSQDHRKQAEILDKIEGQMLNTYVARTGKDRKALTALVKAETWMTAEEALGHGFVDIVTESKQVAAFDLSPFGYMNVPADLHDEGAPIPKALRPGPKGAADLATPPVARGETPPPTPADGEPEDSANPQTLGEAILAEQGEEAAQRRNEDQLSARLRAKQAWAKATVRRLGKDLGLSLP